MPEVLLPVASSFASSLAPIAAVAAMPRTGPSRSQLNAHKLQALSDLKAQSDYLGNSPAANYYGRR